MLAPHPPTVNPPPSPPDLYRKYFEAIINKKRANRRTKISDEAFVRNSRNCLLGLDVELVFSPPPKSSFDESFFQNEFPSFFNFSWRKEKKGKRKKDRIPLLHRSLREIDRIFRLFGSVCLFVFLFWLILSVELFNSEK